jgi:hypothetical protein
MSRHALQIALGAKQAEVDAALKLQGKLKAQVSALEKKAKDSAASLKASFARIGYSVTIPHRSNWRLHGLIWMDTA